MKYILIVLGIVFLIPVAIWIIGSFLPQSHTETVTEKFSASPEEIYSLITDVKSFPAWRSNVERVEVLNDDESNILWREYYSDDDPLSFRIIESTQSQRLVTEIADENLPFGGRWTFDIVPQQEGTSLTITEDGEVYNPIFRFVSTFIIGHDKTIRQYMTDLEGELKN